MVCIANLSEQNGIRALFARLLFCFLVLSSATSWSQDLRSELPLGDKLEVLQIEGRGTKINKCEILKNGRLRCDAESNLSSVDCEYEESLGALKKCVCQFRSKQFVCENPSKRIDAVPVDAFQSRWVLGLRSSTYGESMSTWSVTSYSKAQVEKMYRYEMLSEQQGSKNKNSLVAQVAAGVGYDFKNQEAQGDTFLGFELGQKKDFKWLLVANLKNDLNNLARYDWIVGVGPVFEIPQISSNWRQEIYLGARVSNQNNQEISGLSLAYGVRVRESMRFQYELSYWNVDRLRSSQILRLEFYQNLFSQKLRLSETLDFEQSAWTHKDIQSDRSQFVARLGVLWLF